MAENQVLSPSLKLVAIRWMNACRTQASSRSYKVRNKVLTIAKKEFIALFVFWTAMQCGQYMVVKRCLASLKKINFSHLQFLHLNSSLFVV